MGTDALGGGSEGEICYVGVFDYFEFVLLFPGTVFGFEELIEGVGGQANCFGDET